MVVRTSNGTLPVSTGNPAAVRICGAVPSVTARNGCDTIVRSSIVTAALSRIESRSNDAKANVRFLFSGTAERAAELLLLERRLRQLDRRSRRIEIIEIPAAVQRAIAVEPERVCGDPIGSAPRDDVHDAAGGLSELRRIRVHHHLELAHGVLAEHRAHAASRIVVVVEAVDGDVVGPRALAREREPRRLGRSLVQRAIGRDAGREHGKRDVIAAIDRQLGDLPLGNDRGHDGPLDVDERERRDDIDRRRERREAHRQAYFDVVPNSIVMSSSVTGLKPSSSARIV